MKISRRDRFIDGISYYARQNLFPIYITGLSVLTRLCDGPPPMVEFVAIDDEIHYKQILSSLLQNEYSIIESPPYNGAVLCNLFNSPCYIFLFNMYKQTIVSQIELIHADVRSGRVVMPELYSSHIENKTIPLDHDLNEDLSYFWRTLILTTYLPGFHLDRLPEGISKDILCGTNRNSPLFRFPNEVMNGKMSLSYGALLMRDFLLKSLYNINFPSDIILNEFIDEILNVEALPWFDKSLLSESMNFYKNLEANQKLFPDIDNRRLASVRLATLAMPLFLYSKSNEDVIKNFMASQNFSREFSDMSKLNSIKVDYDRCPLISWLFIGRIGLPSDLVFSCTHICDAYSEIDGDYESIDEWVFITATDFWREALVLTSPEKCPKMLEEIVESKVVLFLNDRRLRISNSELQKLFSVAAIDRTNKQMKSELYQFLKSKPGSTINDFRNSIRQKSRTYFKQMAEKEKKTENNDGDNMES